MSRAQVHVLDAVRVGHGFVDVGNRWNSIIGVMVASVLMLVGCVTPLTPGGQQVSVTDSHDDTKSCKSVGQTSASSGQGGIARSAGFEGAMNSMRNQAADLGGDTLYTMHVSTGFSGSEMMGQAYDCSVKEAAH
jgi:hypothetical protein